MTNVFHKLSRSVNKVADFTLKSQLVMINHENEGNIGPEIEIRIWNGAAAIVDSCHFC